MKILLVTSSYLPKIGGLETVTASLAKGLQDCGKSISVITQRYPRTLPRCERINEIPVQRWYFIFPRLEYLRRRRVDLFFAGILIFPISLILLIARIKSGKPDVVNLHFAGALSLFLLIAHWVLDFQLIVSLHGDDVEGLTRRTRFDRWMFGAILRRADAVTACSHYLLDRAKEFEPSITPKAHVVYNGIGILKTVPSNLSERILAVGRMVNKKGFDLLVNALGILNNLRAQLIGDGPERGTLEQLARELGLQNRITFSGVQSRDEIMRAMAEARVIVIPSRQEPFGMVALEAMSAGKPIVAARVGGLPEILSGADALFFEPDDVSSLVETLERALNVLAHNPKFGERNRERILRFSMDHMIAGYTTVYSSILAQEH